jgi:hypothetical protein
MAADVAQPVRVAVTANCGSLIASSPVKLKWRVNGGATQTASMTLASGQWGANLPATACGSTVAWWVEAETNFSVTRWPANDPRSPRSSATAACALPGDLDGNGLVDAGDIGVMLLRFGTADAAADLDGSGTVDAGDIGVLLLLFG